VVELVTVLQTLEDLPLHGLKDIEGILKKAEIEGTVLDVRELLDLHHHIELCKGLRRFFQKVDPSKAPCLHEAISRLSVLKALEKEILRAVNPKGEILDRASPALMDIRLRLGALRGKAKEVLEHLLRQPRLQGIFQEQFITLRNGRCVLPIKSDAEPRLQGIIHDHSQSRMTFFLEPLQVVALNNEVNILAGEEKEEEYRILGELSARVREERAHLWQDFEILGDLDLLYAMAKLSILLESVPPELNEQGKIGLGKARNPILAIQDKEQVVPIDLRMGDGIKVLILSGANAGGKTVALKTLGLLTAMVQCGLPIPAAEGSEAALFEEIFAVIGDEQSLGENLSTFSSHLLHLDQILRLAGPRSLLLLDELGVGTHASEGCALAMGFLDRFRETGASIVVTTHFDQLKLYGYLYPDVENVAVAFDEQTLEPRYTLRYGSSGVSNAFLVAGKLGISEKVIESAHRHREGSGEEISRALETLEKLKAEAEQDRRELDRVKGEVARERKRLGEVVESLKQSRKEILSRTEERVKKAAQGVEEELRAWLRQKKAETAVSKAPRMSVPRREIQEIRERFFPPVKEERLSAAAGLKVGDRVRIQSLHSEGVLLSVDASLGHAEVVTPKAKVKTSFSDLTQAGREVEEQKAEGKRGPPFMSGEIREPRSQLNVIGLTVEEALPKVDKFIDQALLHGLEKVHIIHGVGSGRLRSAIGKYLQDHRGVKRFDAGDGLKGTAGITVVELR